MQVRAHSAPVQVQLAGDRAQGTAVPVLCVHGIEQPLRVARVASRCGTLDSRACPFEWGGLGNSGRQAGTVRGGDFLDPAREPLPQVEPVTDLQRVRRVVRDALPVRQ
ncbi:hypothetical protein [Streptomyces sp. NPDC003480]